jgi:ABC-type multidrug transport system ATPase subunit
MQTKSLTTPDAVRIQDLTVCYGGGVVALDRLTLTLGPGLFGLLGPNGAGKTTLMRTLATLQPPTSGKLLVFGCDVQSDSAAVRSLLGYLPQDFQTYPQLQAWEVLDYYGILNRLTDRAQRRARVRELLDRVGLAPVADRKAGQLSGGMLRRLGVAQALLNNPRLLILDEPTAGLDPAERIKFRTFLGELSRDRTVLLSTHIVSDIGSSCDRLAVIEKGRLRFEGRRQELLDQVQGKAWRVVVQDADYERSQREYLITAMLEKGDGVELRVLSPEPLAPGWESAEPNLEDAYLWLLQGQSRATPQRITNASVA